MIPLQTTLILSTMNQKKTNPTDQVMRQRILDCRYYNGEQECPFDGLDKCFWDDERIWVTESIPYSEISLDIEILKEKGVIDELQGEGTPDGIIALLYSRLVHWGGDDLSRDNICAFIRGLYQKEPTHRQLEEQ
jgi:hypothetical protein